MIDIRKEYYDNLLLYQIETDEIFDIPEGEAHIRVKTPVREDMQLFLYKNGFFQADRMLKASINLKRNRTELEKKIRLNVRRTDGYREEIRRIAFDSFACGGMMCGASACKATMPDRRFHVKLRSDSETANKIVNSLIDEGEECFVCFYKENVAGFAFVTERQKDVYEICLAAVDEKYRMSGAALSMYAYLAREYQSKSGKTLYGWISTANMAVMNLYAGLGAVFSEPSDIFLKEQRG